MVNKRTLDTIVNTGQMIKADYYYVKNYAVPREIKSIYVTTFELIEKAYRGIKYATEFAYNMVMRK